MSTDHRRAEGCGSDPGSWASGLMMDDYLRSIDRNRTEGPMDTEGKKGVFYTTKKNRMGIMKT